MEEKVKNLCAPIPAGLHARVREEQEASGRTLGQYMAWLIQTFYENQVKEENIMIMDKRTGLYGRLHPVVQAGHRPVPHRLPPGHHSGGGAHGIQ